MAKVAVLHSGGMDSTVCLYLALEQGHKVVSVGINYGQTHQVEMDFAASQCQRLGVERRVIQVRWEKPVREVPMGRTVDEIVTTTSTAFLPGRNVVFVALACAEAAGSKAAEVWIGINQVDFSGYPDCTSEFAERYRDLLRTAMPSGPSLMTPLIDMTKVEIAREAGRFGLGPEDTWSCYRPIQVGGNPKACGRCDACVLHSHAWGGL